MSGQPWFKFFHSDWRSDSALRMCSPAARCLWIEMLCLMVEAEPCGYLLVKGRPVSDRALAVQAGMTVDDVVSGLAELEENGVFSRAAGKQSGITGGVPYSRKMVRDAVKSDQQRARVAKRWGAEKTDKTATGNTEPDTAGITQNVPHGPQARIQKEEPPKAPKGAVQRDLVSTAECDEIWSLTPNESRRRSSKRDLHRALTAAVRRGWQIVEVRDGLVGYFASSEAGREDGAYVKGVHRMVENDRWQSFAERPAGANRAPTWPDDRWRAAVGMFVEEGKWGKTIGPPPSDAGCLAPRSVLLEFGFSPPEGGVRPFDRSAA